MDTLPEFVQDSGEEPLLVEMRSNLTGWETVRFQVADDPESAFSSVFSTAAFAP
jgi:hypothetical protein